MNHVRKRRGMVREGESEGGKGSVRGGMRAAVYPLSDAVLRGCSPR